MWSRWIVQVPDGSLRIRLPLSTPQTSSTTISSLPGSIKYRRSKLRWQPPLWLQGSRQRTPFAAAEDAPLSKSETKSTGKKPLRVMSKAGTDGFTPHVVARVPGLPALEDDEPFDRRNWPTRE
ncbi:MULTISPECIES: hypothetical protein [Burkholderia]|uniref:hypothetical protein n=1 Tax=Burkholderia TaxID=32008 RepID=UPI00126A6D05|nr:MULTISPECIES: hypothetical protein [Burkholderia]